MTVLCFDIASGGISAGVFNSKLETLKRAESRWQITPNEAGEAILTVDILLERFKDVVRGLRVSDPLDAICMGCFMHNCVVLDSENRPLTPIFTWLDRRGEDGVAYIRSRLGDRFHERTGCRYHPMFPLFKIAAIHLRNSPLLAKAKRVVSAKAFLIHRLTGVWIEDYGMASSSGLYSLSSGSWDPHLLSLVGLNGGQLPAVASRNGVVGRVTSAAASEHGLAQGILVVNGSGDGFLASLGSDCETSSKISVSLGTSAVARQALHKPVLDRSSGTFCYQATADEFLLGCAGNNGGNVLDWGRSILGDVNAKTSKDVPIFIPILHGERSPEWNPQLTGSWHGLKAHHTQAELQRSIVEGVAFNLGLFVEILQETSHLSPSEIVLSGNGFLNNPSSQILASVAGMPVSIPADPGSASLRGSAVCALQALGLEVPSLRTLNVSPLTDDRITARYQQYKELRRQI